MSGDASHGEQPAAIERYIAVEIKDELGGATVAYGAVYRFLSFWPGESIYGYYPWRKRL